LELSVKELPQVSLAVGVPKVKLPTPHSLVLLAGHDVKLGRVVSTVAIVWLHSEWLPQASVARQVRVATKVLPQVKFVTVLTMVMVGALQLSVAVGASKLNVPAPHSLVLLGLQVMIGGVLSTTATVFVQVLVQLLGPVTVKVRVKLVLQLAEAMTVTFEAVVEPEMAPPPLIVQAKV